MEQRIKGNGARALLAAGCLFFAAAGMQTGAKVHAAPVRGWVQEGSARCYYRRGEKLLGLQTIGKYQYYFHLKTGNMLRSKWKQINGKYYYFLSNGRMAKKQWINGKYYVNAKGVRLSNCWVGKKFLGENGRWIPNFKGGWQQIDGKWYYYTKKGKKRTGWITYKGNRYYLDANGVRVTKLQTINKNTYLFTKKGIMKNSGWVKSGGWYYYADERGRLNTKERINAKALMDATRIEYNSSTLRLRLQKFYSYGTSFWTAQVQTASPSQMKAALSYGTYGGTRQRTSEAVKSNNAVIGINGSAFSYDTGKPGFDAVMLKNGKIYNKALGTSYSLMAIAADGTMFSPPQGLSAAQLKRGGVRDTFNFGPILLKDGRAASLYEQGYPQVYAGPDMTGSYPRSAVGMVHPGEYVLLVSSGPGLTLAQMRSIFRSYGCTFAYNLDGGGSATMSYKGYVLNSPTDGAERPCGDFLLFGE